MKMHDLDEDSKHPRVARACGIEVEHCRTQPQTKFELLL